MKKKIICLLLIVLSSFGFTKVVEAKQVKLYFLVNCEESRRRYRELKGEEYPNPEVIGSMKRTLRMKLRAI